MSTQEKHIGGAYRRNTQDEQTGGVYRRNTQEEHTEGEHRRRTQEEHTNGGGCTAVGAGNRKERKQGEEETAN